MIFPPLIFLLMLAFFVMAVILLLSLLCVGSAKASARAAPLVVTVAE